MYRLKHVEVQVSWLENAAFDLEEKVNENSSGMYL